jgi:hypothetical protein
MQFLSVYDLGFAEVPLRLGKLGYQHDFADYAALFELLMRFPRVSKRKSLRDERLNLLLLEEIEQRNKVFPKPSRLQPFQRLDAVGDHSLSTRQNPATDSVQREFSGPPKSPTPAGMA